MFRYFCASSFLPRSCKAVSGTSRSNRYSFENIFDSGIIVYSSIIFNSPSILNSSKFIGERHALVKRFDNLLRFIRSLRGFENLLQDSSQSKLLSLVEDSSIVVFNVSDILLNAFLVTINQILSAFLSLLTFDAMKNSIEHFFDAINEQHLSRYSHIKSEMNNILEWLWDVAMSLILDTVNSNSLKFLFMMTSDPEYDEWEVIYWAFFRFIYLNIMTLLSH